MKRALAALTILAASAISAHADDHCPAPEASPSVIYLGDMCEFQETEEVAVIEAPVTDRNAALVDQYGMPTSMPVIMRPGSDTAMVPPSNTPAAAPAEGQSGSAEVKPEDAAKETPAAAPEAEAQPQNQGNDETKKQS